MSLNQEEIILLQFLLIYFKFKMGGFFFLLFFSFLSCLLAVDCLIFQLHPTIQMCISNINKTVHTLHSWDYKHTGEKQNQNIKPKSQNAIPQLQS